MRTNTMSTNTITPSTIRRYIYAVAIAALCYGPLTAEAKTATLLTGQPQLRQLWLPPLASPALGTAMGLRLRPPGTPGRSPLVVKQQAFNCLGVEPGLELVILLPVAITAAIIGAVLITGNIFALRSQQSQVGWGVAAITLGLAGSIAAVILSGIGSQGFDPRCGHMTALAVLSLVVLGSSVILGVVNIAQVIGRYHAKQMAANKVALLPWFSPTQTSGFQGGMALFGQF